MAEVLTHPAASGSAEEPAKAPATPPGEKSPVTPASPPAVKASDVAVGDAGYHSLVRRGKP